MIRQFNRSIVGGVALLAAITAGYALYANDSTSSANTAWTLKERLLPAPAGASPELRENIKATPQPDVAARRATAPDTRKQWDQLLAARTARATPLAELEKSFGVTIEHGRINGVAVHRVEPQRMTTEHKSHLLVYVHGGAYVFGGGDAAPREAAVIAAAAGIPALSIDYRMPPEHPFPAALDDVVAVYTHVLKSYEPEQLAIGGTSAGGGLALATVHKLKALKLPVPGAIYAGTPWADLSKTGDTLFTNQGVDRVLVSYEGTLQAAAKLYADGRDLKEPLLSPVYGDFGGFPPTYLVSGTRDMFLSDTARTHRKLRVAGVVADLNVYEGLSHAGYAFVVESPEHQQVYAELAEFLGEHLKKDSSVLRAK